MIAAAAVSNTSVGTRRTPAINSMVHFHRHYCRAPQEEGRLTVGELKGVYRSVCFRIRWLIYLV